MLINVQSLQVLGLGRSYFRLLSSVFVVLISALERQTKVGSAGILSHVADGY